MITAGIAAFSASAKRERVAPMVGATPAVRIAIFPFTIRGGDNVVYLREGMVDLLSARLDGVGGLTTIDPQSLILSERTQTVSTNERAQALSIAHHVAADQFILGTVVDVGGRIEVTASSYDAQGTLRARVNASAPDEAHIFAAVDKIARDLLAAQFSGAPERMERVAATTTTSLAALKAFLEGERAVRSGQRNVAIDAFNRAVREDSTFALAHYRLSTAALWSSDAALIARSVAMSLRYFDKLPQHERLSLEARNAVALGATDDADRKYRDIVAAYPDDADAWNQLGELVFHAGPWRGRPFTDSRGAFERVLATHPDDANALLHLARIATFEKRRGDVIKLVKSALALNPEREALLELHGLRAVATHDTLERTVLRNLMRINAGASGIDDEVSLIAWRIATYADDPREGASIITAFTDGDANSRMQLREHAVLAHMAAARGRFRDAASELAIMESSDAGFAAETRANLELSLPTVFSGADRARTRKALENLPVSWGTMQSSAEQPREQMARSRHAYLIGALALADGDTVVAMREQRLLLSLGETSNAETELAVHLAHELSARARWQKGDAVGALHEVELGWPKGSNRASLPLYQGEAYTQAHERFFRGELLESLGRSTEALRWFDSVADDQGAGLMLSAQVHLARARIADHHGDRALAVGEFERALSLWGDADVGVAGELQGSRLRLTQLREHQASSATEPPSIRE